MFEYRVYGKYSDYGPISGINHESDNHLELGHNWDTATINDAIYILNNIIELRGAFTYGYFARFALAGINSHVGHINLVWNGDIFATLMHS